MATGTTIKRAKKDAENPWRIMPRAMFEDGRLSFEAKGVLGYILVKPDDWVVRVTDLRKAGKIGRDKAYKILDELIGAGYIERAETRKKDGTIGGTVYLVHEQPLPDSPLPEKPYPVEPDTVNQEHTNKEVILTKNTTKEEDIKASAGATPPVEPAETGSVKEKVSLKDLPAVQVYRDFHHRWPSTAQMKLIAEANVTDIGLWVRVIHEWAGRGYRPVNINGQLEWYAHPSKFEKQEKPQRTKNFVAPTKPQVKDNLYGFQSFIS